MSLYGEANGARPPGGATLGPAALRANIEPTSWTRGRGHPEVVGLRPPKPPCRIGEM